MASVARIGFAGVVAVALFSVTAGADEEQITTEAATATPSTIHGVNFQIKSQLDQTFCVQVESGTTEGRTITLQQCAAGDLQRWAFTNNSDDTNIVADSQGMCLGSRGRKAGDGLALPVSKCKFTDIWRYAYTSQGTIKDIRSGLCLQASTAAANAAVSLATCDPTIKNQLWVVTH